MRYSQAMAVGALIVAMSAIGCNRQTAGSRDTTARPDAARETADRATEAQRQRDRDIIKLGDRVSAVDRTYEEKSAAFPKGTSGTTKFRDELKEDVRHVRTAVDDLKTTTAENWWDREEHALKQTADDIESDVRRLTGTKARAEAARVPGVAKVEGENVSTEPFTSRRDKVVAELRTRVDSMEDAVGKVKAKGPLQAEIDDTKARVKKLGEDLDRLKSASPDDWWTVSKRRVEDYVDRVEASIKRLDDRNNQR
jgi:hypothetical protein